MKHLRHVYTNFLFVINLKLKHNSVSYSYLSTTSWDKGVRSFYRAIGVIEFTITKVSIPRGGICRKLKLGDLTVINN